MPIKSFDISCSWLDSLLSESMRSSRKPPAQRDVPERTALATFANSAGKRVTFEPRCGVPRNMMPATAVCILP